MRIESYWCNKLRKRTNNFFGMILMILIYFENLRDMNSIFGRNSSFFYEKTRILRIMSYLHNNLLQWVLKFMRTCITHLVVSHFGISGKYKYHLPHIFFIVKKIVKFIYTCLREYQWDGNFSKLRICFRQLWQEPQRRDAIMKLLHTFSPQWIKIPYQELVYW